METRPSGWIPRYFETWSLFEKAWLLIFTLVNIYLFIAWHDTWIGLLASLSGMLCVVLTAKGRVSSYYWGILNVLLYSYISLGAKYYGEVMLNMLYFFPLQFVGIYYWRKHRTNQSFEVSVAKLGRGERWLWALLSLVGIAVYGLFLAHLGGTLPFVDSTSTVLSVVAMILLIKRASEQWILWIIVDIVSVVMWFYVLATGGNDISMLIMWSAYLVNAVYGYVVWRRRT